MAPQGNQMMAEGVLLALGLDDVQIAKAKASWFDISTPITVELSKWVSFKEYNKLAELAAKENLSVDEFAHRETSKALDALLAKNEVSESLPKNPPSQTTDYEQKVAQRIDEVLKSVHYNPDYFTNGYLIGHQDSLALLLLFKNENVEDANRLILAFCERERKKVADGGNPSTRCESLMRAYLMERTHPFLSAETRMAIEDYAWELLNKQNRGVTLANANERFFKDWQRSENHFVNDRRRYLLALQILRKADRFGPEAKFEGTTIDAHCRAWYKFWIQYFRDRANEGTDSEIAQASGYAACTVGVYYDLYDLAENAEVRELAGKFLTLYWAEVAAEFEPRTGRPGGLASLRTPGYGAILTYWARQLSYCYHWHDDFKDPDRFSLSPVDVATFFTSGYRPPQILSAIAHDPNRGNYLSTSRRANMKPDDPTKIKDTIVFDQNGDSHFRRDVFYTPDYALSTMTSNPKRKYDIISQTLGATFAAGLDRWIKVDGRGGYNERLVNGITGNGVSIFARDPNASTEVGGKYVSRGTHIFISNGELWDNRIEDKSVWFFTRAGNAYVAIRVAWQGYQISDNTIAWDRAGGKFHEEVQKDGHFLVLNDPWAPMVIQMGRAVDYKNFEDFQASVKAKRFDYADGKLTYESEAKDTYEYWAKGAQPPRINGTEVNLNPVKTFDSPFLSMVHGSSKAVITYPGHKEVVLEFSPRNK